MRNTGFRVEVARRSYREDVEPESRVLREVEGEASPEEWLPLFTDVHDCLLALSAGTDIRPVVAGAAAYALHIEADPTKDIDFVLSRPLEVGRLVDLLNMLTQLLRERGWRVIGGRVQQGRGSEDWVVQTFVVVRPGRVVGLEVFNLLAVRPLALYEVEEIMYLERRFLTLTRESWVASKLADPNGVTERNLRRLERMVESGIDETKLFQTLMRLSLNEVVQNNAKDMLRRTKNEKLKRILSILV